MHRTRLTATIIAATVAFALLAAACSPQQPAGDGGEGLPGEAAEIAYAQCMREHGIDFPDPEFVDGGWELRLGEGVDPDSPEFVAAETACAELRDAAQQGGGDGDPTDGGLLEAEMERMLRFAACMRDQGIDFPDPRFEEGGISGPAGPLDGDQAAFDEARAVCEEQTGQRMD